MNQETKHKFHKCSKEDCFVCNGGLKYCDACGGAEVTLPFNCPERKMTEDEERKIANYDLDYVNGGWVIPKKKIYA
jgi:hypothetical protein